MEEYLAALDEAAEPDPDRNEPKVVSPSDPSSAWTARANKRVQFGYGLNYLIDLDEVVIVDLAAIVQNLKTLALRLNRPPPQPICAPRQLVE